MMCATILALLLAACTRQPGSFGLDPDRVSQLDEILSRMAADETFIGFRYFYHIHSISIRYHTLLVPLPTIKVKHAGLQE
jgi:hypothetical protein